MLFPGKIPVTTGYTMKSTLFILMLLAITAAAGSVRADIYRLDGDDETIFFTDSPHDKRFQLVMKEQQVVKSKKGSGKRLNAQQGGETASALPGADAAPGARNLPLQGRITSPIGLRSDPIDGRLRHHNGLDIAAPSGTPVKPVAPGTVIFSGWKSGYGNTVILDHNDGMITLYAHHANNSVSEGATVDSDTVIAYSGSSGRSTGPHLHFEAWRNGVNISAEFMPDSMAAGSGPLVSATVTRYLQPDGTIVFTNLR